MRPPRRGFARRGLDATSNLEEGRDPGPRSARYERPPRRRPGGPCEGSPAAARARGVPDAERADLQKRIDEIQEFHAKSIGDDTDARADRKSVV